MPSASAEQGETIFLHVFTTCELFPRSTENGVLQVGASQYMAALIIGFVNSATIQVARPGCPVCPDHRAARHASSNC